MRCFILHIYIYLFYWKERAPYHALGPLDGTLDEMPRPIQQPGAPRAHDNVHSIVSTLEKALFLIMYFHFGDIADKAKNDISVCIS